jgi:hypothetical protein
MDRAMHRMLVAVRVVEHTFRSGCASVHRERGSPCITVSVSRSNQAVGRKQVVSYSQALD